MTDWVRWSENITLMQKAQDLLSDSPMWEYGRDILPPFIRIPLTSDLMFVLKNNNTWTMALIKPSRHTRI